MAVRWSATLRAPDDGSQVLADLGSRFASCTYTSSLNAGWDAMQTTLRLPGGNLDRPRVPVDYACEIFRFWRGMIGRVFIEGALAWCGRVAQITIGDVDPDGGCIVQVSWLGLIHDLERERPELGAGFSDEFATVSASQVIRAVFDQTASPIAKLYTFVEETSVNVGAVPVSVQDTSLSLIVNQLKGASSDGVEFTLLVYEPENGPIVTPIGQGPVRYRLRMAGSPGASLTWSLSEYVSDCLALFTNADGLADASSSEQSQLGPLLNGGLSALRAISVDGVNADGADAARDAFLALHADPIGISGSFTMQDFIQNFLGGKELAGLVRAGEIATVVDALPYDNQLTTAAAKSWAIATTSYDVFSGQLSLTLDQRSIDSRENERQTDVRVNQRILEPGLSHNLLKDTHEQFETPVVITNNTDTQVTDPITFTSQRTARVRVEIFLEITDTGPSVQDSRWQIGCAFDGDAWDHTNQEQMSVDYIRTGVNGGTAPLTGMPKPQFLAAGTHTITIYARDDAGSYSVSVCRVRILG